MPPATRYARSGDIHIAYQVVGDGPFDLLFVPGFVSHLEANWDDPNIAAVFERLARFSRLILFESSSPTPSRTSWPGPASASPSAACMPSRGCPASGGCSRWSAARGLRGVSEDPPIPPLGDRGCWTAFGLWAAARSGTPRPPGQSQTVARSRQAVGMGARIPSRDLTGPPQSRGGRPRRSKRSGHSVHRASDARQYSFATRTRSA